MPDRYASNASSLTAPASHGFAVTPSDTADLPETTRALYVGAAGTLVVRPFLGRDRDLRQRARPPRFCRCGATASCSREQPREVLSAFSRTVPVKPEAVQATPAEPYRIFADGQAGVTFAVAAQYCTAANHDSRPQTLQKPAGRPPSTGREARRHGKFTIFRDTRPRSRGNFIKL